MASIVMPPAHERPGLHGTVTVGGVHPAGVSTGWPPTRSDRGCPPVGSRRPDVPDDPRSRCGHVRSRRRMRHTGSVAEVPLGRPSGESAGPPPPLGPGLPGQRPPLFRGTHGALRRDLPACHEDWSSPSDRRVPVDAVPEPGWARSQRAATADPMPGPASPLRAQSRCSQEFGGVTYCVRSRDVARHPAQPDSQGRNEQWP